MKQPNPSPGPSPCHSQHSALETLANPTSAIAACSRPSRPPRAPAAPALLCSAPAAAPHWLPRSIARLPGRQMQRRPRRRAPLVQPRYSVYNSFFENGSRLRMVLLHTVDGRQWCG